jgi:hypothetical protein
VGWYLGIDLGADLGNGSGMHSLTAALWHSSTTTLYPLGCPGAAGAVVSGEAGGESPAGFGPGGGTLSGAWIQRGLTWAIAGTADSVAWPQLRMGWEDSGAEWLIPLERVRQQLTQQLRRLPIEAVPQGGVPPEPWAKIWHNLTGVICAAPTTVVGAADCYCFNVREAVLGAGLVASPDQIFFVDAAIAPLVAASGPDGPTLVLTTNAWTTDVALVDATTMGMAREPVGNGDGWPVWSFAYGDGAVVQDVLGQMFYAALTDPAVQPGGNADWVLPLPGEPDPLVRDRLQQRLASTAMGRQWLWTGQQVSAAFAQQPALEFTIQGETRTVRQADFYRVVLGPYLKRLNREMDAALAQQGLAVGDVRRLVCAGGLARLGVVGQWLRRKFPNLAEADGAGWDAGADRVARGEPDRGQQTRGQRAVYLDGTAIAARLAQLPQFPQWFNAQQHQYSDLFLLRELLTRLPPEPLTVGQILRQLGQAGIHTSACQGRILRLLAGELPRGLVPLPEDAAVVAGGLTLANAVFRQWSGGYQVEAAAGDRLRSYLQAMVAGRRQSLAEPLSWAALVDQH